MELLLLLLSGLVSAILVGWWHWENHVKQHPLKDFGMEDVQRALRFEPEPVRKQILTRGWMTNAEWLDMNNRHVEAIEAELRRRGINKP